MSKLALMVMAALLAFTSAVVLPVEKVVEVRPPVIGASGSSSARLTWRLNNFFGSPLPFYPGRVRVTIGRGAELARLVGPTECDRGRALLEVGIRPRPGRAGTVELVVDQDGRRHLLDLRIQASSGDSDADGIPDMVELGDEADRQAFRAWFTAVAAAQFDGVSGDWEAVQRDCAGLVRYAFAQALRRHDDAWRARHPRLGRLALADVAKYSYPRLPVLGDRPFRIRPGSFRQDDIPGAFSASASARVLWEFNTVLVGRHLEAARPGDLLVFRDRRRQPMPMHLMIMLDDGSIGPAARVVYHTGPDGSGNPGQVRLVTIAALDSHGDDSWHVRADNPHFLGFYRFKILEGGSS